VSAALRPLPIGGWLRPAWTDEPERLDEADLDAAQLAENLDDLRRVNRWLGGTGLSLWGLELLTRGWDRGRGLTVLDLATGGADIPWAMQRWGERRGLRVKVIATDLNEQILRLGVHWRPAVRRLATPPSFAIADARSLPFGPASVDIVHCSLSLHHLGPAEAERMLAEMGRVSRIGVVVNDLVRSWPGYWGAWLFGHLATRNPLTRNDAPLSVRRAYTRSQLGSMAQRAGLRPTGWCSLAGYRMAMVAQPTKGGSPA
jgi:ubiquinone/menaquinone biosynthesis C-methylase UbiE